MNPFRTALIIPIHLVVRALW